LTPNNSGSLKPRKLNFTGSEEGYAFFRNPSTVGAGDPLKPKHSDPNIARDTFLTSHFGKYSNPNNSKPELDIAAVPTAFYTA